MTEKFAIYLDSEEEFHSREFQRQVEKFIGYIFALAGERPVRGEERNVFLINLTDDQVGFLWQYDGIGEIIPHAEYLERVKDKDG